jgi:hypothetical protein
MKRITHLWVIFFTSPLIVIQERKPTTENTMKAPYGNMTAYLKKEIHLIKFKEKGTLLKIENIYNTINGWGDSQEFSILVVVNGVERWFRVSPSDVEFADPNEPKGYGYRD